MIKKHGPEFGARKLFAVGTLLATSIGGTACRPEQVTASINICAGQTAVTECLSGLAGTTPSPAAAVAPPVESAPVTPPTFTRQQLEFFRVIQINSTMAPSDAALARLRGCEAGGRYTAVNPSGKYRGAYQFDQRTWNGVVGGAAHLPDFVGMPPEMAKPAVQDAAARILYDARGSAPWPVCGARI